MQRKLKNLNIAGIRGAIKSVDIPFNGTKGMTLIFGENGTGKTSIVDALDIVCNGQFGIVTTMSGATASHVPSVGREEPASSVTLSLSDGSDFSATLRGREIDISPDIGCPKAFILRRKTLLDFIEKAPVERFNALRVFINTQNLDSAESSLRELINQKKRDQKGKDQERKADNQNIKNIWSQETEGKGDILAWVKAIVDEEITEDTLPVEQLQSCISNLDDLFRQKKSMVELKTNLDSAVAAKEIASNEFQEIIKLSVANAPAIVNLLSNAKSIIQESKQDHCPVCLQAIDPDSVLNDLSERIRDLQGVMVASKTLKNAEEVALRESIDLNSALKTLATSCIAGASLLNSFIEKGIFPEIKTDLGFRDDVIPEKFSEAVYASVCEFIEEVICHKDTLLSLMQDTPKRLQLQKDLKPLVANALKAKNDLQTLNDEIKVLVEFQKICETRRKKFIAGELASISSRVGQLYGTIHPDENIGAPVLRVVPGKRASVELTGKFHTEENVPPQAYFSESHLDTLGICIFFALSEKYANEDDIVVLDDILTSVDAEHLKRTLEMYSEVCSHFNHLVCTTHYRKIMNLYKFGRVSANVETLELGYWSLDDGIRIVNASQEVDLLTNLTQESPIERQSIASKCGILLESIFDFLTFKYACPMQRKHTGYTLNELLNAILSRTRLRRVLQVEKCLKDDTTGVTQVQETHNLESILRDILAVCSVRNDVGCHFKFEAGDVTDAEVKEFAEKTLELANLLICPENGDFPNKDRSGSYWETKNGLLRLKPLAEPRDN